MSDVITITESPVIEPVTIAIPDIQNEEIQVDVASVLSEEESEKIKNILMSESLEDIKQTAIAYGAKPAVKVDEHKQFLYNLLKKDGIDFFPLTPIASAETVEDVEPIEKAKPEKKITKTSVKESAYTIIRVKLENLYIDHNKNYRDRTTQEYQNHINFLKESIKTEGFWDSSAVVARITPENKTELDDGFCRCEAARQLMAEGHPEILIPVSFEDGLISNAERIKRKLKTNSGLRFTYLEESQIARDLHNLKMSIKEIGLAFNPIKNETEIKSLLVVNVATPQTKELISNNLVLPTVVVSLVRELGADKAQDLLVTAISERDRAVTGEDVKDIKEQISEGLIDVQETQQQKPVETVIERAKSDPDSVKRKKRITTGNTYGTSKASSNGFSGKKQNASAKQDSNIGNIYKMLVNQLLKTEGVKVTIDDKTLEIKVSFEDKADFNQGKINMKELQKLADMTDNRRLH